MSEQQSALISHEPLSNIVKQIIIAVLFSIAFAYIEAAVVVYLRTIFHPDGFTFPLTTFGTSPLWRQLLITEIGREAATLALIFTAAWLFGSNRPQRFAYFLTIFAIWDIFYYVWLKILIGWPASLFDWDILFLIPMVWASPLIAPVLISITLLVFAMIIFFRSAHGKAIKVSPLEWLIFACTGIVVLVSFCIPGPHIAEADFKSYFYWPLFFAGHLCAVGMFVKCLCSSKIR